jgi:hypothetical protein
LGVLACEFLTFPHVAVRRPVLAILGTGLIFVSLMAFQHSISPESQSKSLDTALATFEKSATVRILIKLVTFPWHALIACKDGLLWLLVLPFRAIAGTLKGLGQAGDATIYALNRCIQWLVNLPIQLAQYFVGAIGRGLTSMSEGLTNQSRQLGRTLSGSLLGTFFTALADVFSSATAGMGLAWIRCNQVVADGAFAVEAFGRQVVQVLQQGVAHTIAGWLTTKSVVVKSTVAVRTRWVAVNLTVADGAFLVDDKLKLIQKHATTLMSSIRTRTAAMGISQETIRATCVQGKDIVAAGYCRANEGATEIGFLLEGLIQKVSSKIRDVRSSMRARQT